MAREIVYDNNSAENFRLFNFATGSYCCRCSVCGREFYGDKRAVQCLACALNFAEQNSNDLRLLRAKFNALLDILEPMKSDPALINSEDPRCHSPEPSKEELKPTLKIFIENDKIAQVKFLPTGQLECTKCDGYKFTIAKTEEDGVVTIAAYCNTCRLWYILAVYETR